MRKLRRAHKRHTVREARRRGKLRRRAVTAGTVAAIAFGTGAGMKIADAYAPDSHQLPVGDDSDGDWLADSEEVALAYLPFNPDQNKNQIPDGVELAKQSFVDINDVPVWDPDSGRPQPQELYKTIVAAAFGYEKCAVCGADVTMIKWELVNPHNGLRVQFTGMSMHYLEHGSFTYHSTDPWSGKGRLDVRDLLKALQLRLPSEPDDHQLPVTYDADGDLLADREEFSIGYRPFDSDQNHNTIQDGVELARRCAAAVDALPSYPPMLIPPDIKEIYRIEHALDGLEQCSVCGRWIHMGGWTIVNPRLGIRYPDSEDPLDALFLPDLALHYMEHGSIDCYGQEHQGRVDIQRLMRVLEVSFPHDPNAHQLPIAGDDLDGDLLTDVEELTTAFDLDDPDQNENITPDGIDLAKQCNEAIDALPVREPNAPSLTEIHKVPFLQRGLEYCQICGASCNMGYWRVVNPGLHLSIEVPHIVCHYMSHGSFSYSGDIHGRDRVDVPLLLKVLEMPVQCGDLGTLYTPGDLNEDCKSDFRDLAELADRWLQSTDPNQSVDNG